MVFQSYALYPHMSVYDNMAFSLRYRNTPRAEIGARVREAAEILGQAGLGAQAEAALRRSAPARRHGPGDRTQTAGLFVGDERMSNLDAKLRGSMRLEMKKLHQQLGVTTVFVTHDQIEAMTMADRVVVMNGWIISNRSARPMKFITRRRKPAWWPASSARRR